MSELPPGLKKRWEQFGALSRECWLKAKKDPSQPAEKQFPIFWECMKEGDPSASQTEISECAEIGRPLAPHPICVIAQTVRGIEPAEAVKICLAEGRVHGISLLACRAAKAGELT
jgi:hypothetical protein